MRIVVVVDIKSSAMLLFFESEKTGADVDTTQMATALLLRVSKTITKVLLNRQQSFVPGLRPGDPEVSLFRTVSIRISRGRRFENTSTCPLFRPFSPPLSPRKLV